MPEQGEHHVAIPLELLAAMGQLFQIKGGMYQSEERRAVVLVLQAMGIDPITGTIVVGVSIRDLDP